MLTVQKNALNFKSAFLQDLELLIENFFGRPIFFSNTTKIKCFHDIFIIQKKFKTIPTSKKKIIKENQIFILKKY